ncbi:MULTISPECIES: MogA/MoaB family molybdenum cofactor biosynthesis protein [unclassified Desulfovibrio]|uniref:MogA/MoaB family molybdenum cofactor biosynthesis protein n=1 Tax=unclassified Desulfovibrio TaxID=2593640 RepID=UPI0013EBB7FD|nr:MULTISPECIES: MogA/MoaB family molybdenum cofactor biosynthesis protein [unclassified Desulfovibrio]
MEIRCSPCDCRQGEVLALVAGEDGARDIHRIATASLGAQKLAAGWTLADPETPATALFRVVGRAWREDAGGCARSCPLLEALAPVREGAPRTFLAEKRGFAAAWVTLSDKGAAGERKDEAGPLIGAMLGEALPLALCRGFLLPDEPALLRALLSDLALHQGYDLVCTTGGTGLSPRDRTPEATEKVLDYLVPGMAQAMMAVSLAATPRAVLSRAVAGVAGRCLILNLPGSPRAVRENLGAVLPALAHALAKLGGDAADCGEG